MKKLLSMIVAIVISQYSYSQIEIINNGNVGIGITSPQQKLHVVGPAVYLASTSIGRSGSSFDEIGYNVGFTTTSGAYTYRNNNFAVSIMMGADGGFRFKTAPSGTSGTNLTLTERMRITLDGNVGIGHNNPQQKLHVVGQVYLGGTMSLGRSGSHYDEIGYNLGFTTTSNVYTYRGSNFAASIRMGSNGSIEFRTAPSGTAGANLTLTERMKITLDGNVGIGTTTPEYKLDVNGEVRIIPPSAGSQSTGVIFGNYNHYLTPNMSTKRSAIYPIANNLLVLGRPDSWFRDLYVYNIDYQNLYQTSDMRLKENIRPCPSFLSKLKDVKAYNYNYTDEYFKDFTPEDKQRAQKTEYGFLAQELQKIFPELVREDDGTGMLSISYITMIPILTSAINELQQKVEYLEKRLSEMENKKGGK